MGKDLPDNPTSKPHVLVPWGCSRLKRSCGAAVGAGLQLSIDATNCVGTEGKAAACAILAASAKVRRSRTVIVFPHARPPLLTNNDPPKLCIANRKIVENDETVGSKTSCKQ